MNPKPIRIACQMMLTSITLYVTDALLRADNSVAGATLLILGTLFAHLVRRIGSNTHAGTSV
ncbi:hypothetical protein [Paraburkholderia sp. J12]|uniref:hypothetical protein n=1 Tax=Paraburkholderia sp. J12 TaxID=2805432 RepID=UPI002ABD3308|nr:hypothetical protein [Paraburkholderia sp. J12]